MTGKESACQAGGTSSIPGLDRSPGEGNGKPLQYPYLGNPDEQRSPAGYRSRGHKDSTWLSCWTTVAAELSSTLQRLLALEAAVSLGSSSQAKVLGGPSDMSSVVRTNHKALCGVSIELHRLCAFLYVSRTPAASLRVFVYYYSFFSLEFRMFET